MEAIYALLEQSLPSLMPALVVSVVLGYLGTRAVPTLKSLPPSGFKSALLVTAWAHPVLIGSLLGLFPGLAVPTWMGDTAVSAVLWYALAGVAALPIYGAFAARLTRLTRQTQDAAAGAAADAAADVAAGDPTGTAAATAAADGASERLP